MNMLTDLAARVFTVAPTGVDYTVDPTGTVTFSDAARPGTTFRYQPDDQDPQGALSWAIWEADGDHHSADGCTVENAVELVEALSRWVFGVTDYGQLMDYGTASPLGPATREQRIASLAAAGKNGDGDWAEAGAGVILIDSRGQVRINAFGPERFRPVYVVG